MRKKATKTHVFMLKNACFYAQRTFFYAKLALNKGSYYQSAKNV